MKIKFGTDGWRALIAHEFTTDNVARLSYGVANWLTHQENLPKKVVVGHDCRFGGQLFTETIAKVLTDANIEVVLANTMVTTPMISLAAKELNCGLGIIITASHNPAAYSGYKLKGNYGGPLLPKELTQIEDLIPPLNTLDLNSVEVADLEKNGSLSYVDLESLYLRKIEQRFDLEKMRELKGKVAFDAMYGSGQFIFKKILPEANHFRAEHNPTFYGISPEPIPKNTQAYAKFLTDTPEAEVGLIVDGDADRIGLMDGEGNYIDSHHIMLLLVHYLAKYKGQKGEVATGFSTTNTLKKLCDHYGFALTVVPIGFKHVCKMMLETNILMGGEESGGIAINGHIPERDGIWNGLTLVEAVLETGKSLRELIDEIYAISGAFAYHRIDLKLAEEKKQEIVASCQNKAYTSFGSFGVKSLETLDGFKYILDENSWLMIRPSGTEPVLRTYAEAENREKVDAILQACHETILK